MSVFDWAPTGVEPTATASELRSQPDASSVCAPQRHPGTPGRPGTSSAVRDAAVESRRPGHRRTRATWLGFGETTSSSGSWASTVAKQGLGNPITDFNLINSVKADLSFDQTWAVSDMANLVLDFHSVDVNSVPQLTLPVPVVTDPEGGGGLMYEGTNYGDVEFPAEVAGPDRDRPGARHRADDRFDDRQPAALAVVGRPSRCSTAPVPTTRPPTPLPL